MFFLSCLFAYDCQSQDNYVDVKMGESEAAMEYDQELIFKHLFVHFKYLSIPSANPLCLDSKDVSISTLLRMHVNIACLSNQNMRVKLMTGWVTATWWPMIR